MAHLARSKAPKSWPIKRKETKWITRPNSGAHPLNRCISINLLLKSILKHAETTREVKYILNNGSVIVDKRTVKDKKFAVGFMDILDIPETNESYRVIIDELGEFKLIQLKKELDNLKPCKIIGKVILKGKNMQINLIDSRNIIVEKNSYNVGDTVILDVTKNLIVDSLKFEEGCNVFLIGGKHMGTYGKVLKIIKEKSTNPDRVLVKTKDLEFETLKKYAFVIDIKFIEK